MYVSAMKIRNALLCKHHKVSKVSLRYGTECRNNGRPQLDHERIERILSFIHLYHVIYDSLINTCGGYAISVVKVNGLRFV